jgi:hypothetical protein
VRAHDDSAEGNPVGAVGYEGRFMGLRPAGPNLLLHLSQFLLSDPLHQPG